MILQNAQKHDVQISSLTLSSSLALEAQPKLIVAVLYVNVAQNTTVC